MIPTAERPAYQPHLDAIRGIAVALVLLFHFQLLGIRGGFIGVDVFFVLSGYLITGLLLQAPLQGSSLAHFYRRRLLRLMPAFLVFSAITTLAAAALLLPEDWLDYLRSLRESLLFNANHYFARELSDYFARAAHELPLLHTWSLSIEWQFYLGYPALLLALRRYTSLARLRWIVLAATLALTATSIQQSLQPESAYFSTLARLFELLLGASACLGWPATSRPGRWQGALASIALPLLIGLGWVYTESMPLPGLPALAVCLLTLCLLAWGQDNLLLKLPPLQYLGRISYSAYLWHWPLVAFTHYLSVPLSLALQLALLGGTLLLAAASHHWVEEPARRWKGSLRTCLAGLVVVPALVVIAVLYQSKTHSGWPERLGEGARYAHAHLAPYLDTNQRQCHDFRGGTPEQCAFGDLAGSRQAILLGDSHARHFWWFTDKLARQAGVKVYAFSGSACLMLPGVAQTFRGRRYTDCESAAERHFRAIDQRRYQYVLLAERWLVYSPAQWAALDHTVARILAAGATPVIFRQVAEDEVDQLACFNAHLKLRQSYRNHCGIDQNTPFQRDKRLALAALFDRLARQYPAVRWIDPQQSLCHAGRCLTVHDRTPLYDDSNHLNGYASSLLADWHLQQFPNPLR